MSETRPVRTGEEIDLSALDAYLRSTHFTRAGDIAIEQFPAGSSNLTYLVRIGDDEYVLRRPPFGNTVRTAHDMRREFDVLSRLSEVYRPAPRPLLFCDDETVIGSEFYLMERRRGLIIRGNIEPGRDASVNERAASNRGRAEADRDASVNGRADSNRGRIEAGSDGSSGIAAERTAAHLLDTSQPYREKVCRSFISNLADLHAVDYRAAGLGDLGRPDGYCRRQVEGWAGRYFAAKTHEWPELERAIDWLSGNIPAAAGSASLIHNDYKFDNVMLDANDLTKITAVLDWEMVTVGDPLMDLGTTLGYWMSADAGEEMLNMPFNPRVLMENVTRQDLVEMYYSAAGRDTSNILFYYVFGTFKIAVIAQQIYARFARGLTRDQRFAVFDSFVGRLGRISSAAVRRGKL